MKTKDEWFGEYEKRTTFASKAFRDLAKYDFGMGFDAGAESKEKELSDFKALVKQMRATQGKAPHFNVPSERWFLEQQVDKILGL